jgi:hypothetical protein
LEHGCKKDQAFDARRIGLTVSIQGEGLRI